MLTGSASAQQCICLDEYGNVYPKETLSTAICYQYNSDNVLVATTTTFKQCQDMNAAYMQVEQEKIRQQQALEEQQRQQALEEQQRQQALEEQQRQQALEEQQRQQALEEQQRQQALEEQQRQQALEEQQRQQALEEQQRQQALEEQYDDISDTLVTLQNETNDLQSGLQSTEQIDQISEPIQVQVFSLSQSGSDKLVPDSNNANTNGSLFNLEENDVNSGILTGNNEDNSTQNGIITGNNEDTVTNNNVITGNNEDNDINNDVITGNNEDNITNNNVIAGNNEDNVTNKDVITGNNEDNVTNNNVITGNNEDNDTNNDVITGNNENNDTNNDITAGNNEDNDINNNVITGNNEVDDINNDVITGNNEDDVTNNDVITGNNEDNVTNNDITTGNNDVTAGNGEDNDANDDKTTVKNTEGDESNDITSIPAVQVEKQNGETKIDAEDGQTPSIPETVLTLTDETAAELSVLLTEEEFAALSTFLTREWLEANIETLSETAFAELSAMLPPEEPITQVKLLKAPASAVSIEGKLLSIMLSKPNGSTEDASAVPFIWLYDYDTTTGSSDVTFNLILDITTDSDSMSSTRTVSSASCEDRICSYTVDLSSSLEESEQATVSWTVSGSYKDGETTITIPAPASQSFIIKAPSPTPVPPTPTPKPDAPVPEAPNGTHTARSIGFYWKPSKNAETYTVEWKHQSGKKGSMNLGAQDETCKKGKCIIYATLPDTGNYTWTVTAKNASGSTVSSEMKFKIINNLPTPNPYRPNGTIFNHTYPAFEWEDVRNGAYEYRIQVVGKYDNRLRMDHWFNVNDIYVGKGVCYLQSNLFLPAGSYSWRVMAKNGDTTSGWSFWRDFYVECDYCNYNNVYYQNYANTVPTCSYPVGTITVNTPDFQWRTLTGASYYTVTLYDASGSVLFNEQVSNSACTAELCSWSPKYRLTKNGNYSWYVSGYGANGSRWGSANTTFTLNGAVVMKAMSFLRPAQNGLLTDDAPVIIWTDPGETTALFHVEIFNSSNTSLFSADLNRAQAWCDGQTCSIEFKTIPNAENYRITVTPYSELNTVGDAISLVFSKGGIPMKLNSPKEGSTVSSRPLFRWTLDAGTNVRYELILTDANNNVSTFSPLVCGAVGVTCEENEAFFSPSDPLPLGSYTARIVAPGSVFISEDLHFTIR